mmetsp:Transcript_6253/g.11553  ORF Transcript_6253/g.11553 Transcript_6253/m.11553 type:complete len:255 (-) Transcript_6253:1443-2207(-)
MAGPKLKSKAVEKYKGQNKAIERKKEIEFKVPAPKVRRKKVLDEDTYVENMEHIIRRDYFPDLHAVESLNSLTPGTPGVTPGIPGSVRGRIEDTPLSQLRGTSFEEDTPLISRDADPMDNHEPGTPMSAVSGFTLDSTLGNHTKDTTITPNETKKFKRAKDMSLDQFAATHTSQDNASFQDILAKDRVKQRKRYWWLKEKEIQGQRLTAGTDDSSTAKIKFWKYTNKNALMYVPDAHNASSSSSSSCSLFEASG